MSDIGRAPEPSQQEVAAAFGQDVANNFEQIRSKSMTERMIPDATAREEIAKTFPPKSASVSNFEENWNLLTVEINRLGIIKATEILRNHRDTK